MKDQFSLTRRSFLKTGAASVLGMVASAPAKSFRKSKPPHIFLIMTDQHRGDCLGCAGNNAIKTPHLDALSADGVLFSNGYTSTPSCTPARSALLTGLSPWHHGMLGYGRVAAKYKFEMPQMLRDSGYYTFGIGKMHWFPQKTLHGFHGTLVDESGRVETPDFVSDYHDWFKLHAPGLDPNATGIGWNEHRGGVYQLDEELHPTHWTGQTAVDFIRHYKLENPLFLKTSFARPHSPYDPPQRFFDLYKNADVPKPVSGDWCARFADFPNTPSAAYGDFGVEHALDSRRHYYANITFIDEQIGKFIAALKDKGMYDNAVIIFTADHGDMLGDHFHWRKTYAYQGSAHIPFILKWPTKFKAAVSRGSSLAHPVELRDVLPTFLDAANENIPDKMDGDSLLKLVHDPGSDWRPWIDLEHSTCYSQDNYWCALSDGKMKYIWFFRTGEEQLFDLASDPDELENLASLKEHSERLSRWRGRMVDHLRERGEGFVKEGKLVQRTETMLYSPNYPAS